MSPCMCGTLVCMYDPPICVDPPLCACGPSITSMCIVDKWALRLLIISSGVDRMGSRPLEHC